MTHHILLIDDEAPVLAALRRTLRTAFGQKLVVEAYTDTEAALARAEQRSFDIVLSDLRMPKMDGVTLLTRLARVQPDGVRMLLSASTDFDTAQRAINEAGLFRYLVKPWVESELIGHFEAALAVARARQSMPFESAQDAERRRLEALEPGITHVEWGPAGEVLMPLLSRL